MRKTSRVKHAVGWLLSVVWVALCLSPQAQLLFHLPDSFHLAAGQDLSLQVPYPLTLTMQEAGVAANASQDQQLSDEKSDTATISLFGLFPLRDVKVDISDEMRLYPGGQAVGVALHTDGLLVVGTSDLSGAYSPARIAGIRAGDLITAANGKSLSRTEELTALVAAAGERPIPLTVKRGDSVLSLTLTPKKDAQTGDYRIGAWVRDSTAGVGTMSFYGKLDDKEPVSYGALGHAITDADTQKLLTVGYGQIMMADVVDVRKGQAGYPGELKGSFLREQRILGTIASNSVFGIYGTLSQQPDHPIYPDGLPIGRKDAVHTGPATILCTVGPDGMKEYDVEIVEVARQSSPAQRSMVLRVTDEELLKRTGGIVQGMSGSPILQDGRLIGAVTHVFVNDPTMGYGLFIEWMLQTAEMTQQQAS